jgi:hypothetical protein
MYERISSTFFFKLPYTGEWLKDEYIPEDGTIFIIHVLQCSLKPITPLVFHIAGLPCFFFSPCRYPVVTVNDMPLAHIFLNEPICIREQSPWKMYHGDDTELYVSGRVEQLIRR